MTFDQFVYSAFLLLLTGGVYVLWMMYRELGQLNAKVSVILSQQVDHKDKLRDHEDRIRNLERNPALV